MYTWRGILTKESSVDTNVDTNRERAKVDYGFKTTTTTTITFKNLTEWWDLPLSLLLHVACLVVMETAKEHYSASLIFKSPRHLRCKCNVL